MGYHPNEPTPTSPSFSPDLFKRWRRNACKLCASFFSILFLKTSIIVMRCLTSIGTWVWSLYGLDHTTVLWVSGPKEDKDKKQSKTGPKKKKKEPAIKTWTVFKYQQALGYKARVVAMTPPYITTSTPLLFISLHCLYNSFTCTQALSFMNFLVCYWTGSFMRTEISSQIYYCFLSNNHYVIAAL